MANLLVPKTKNNGHGDAAYAHRRVPTPSDNNSHHSNLDTISGNDLDSSGSGQGHGDSPPPEGNKTKEIASRETTQVKHLRLLLIAVLLAVATATSVSMYMFTRNSETIEFESAFEGQGDKLISGFQQDSLRKLQAIDSLSGRITAFALNTNATWPFVTIPDSSELLEPYRQIAGAAALQVMPIVTPRLRDAWEQYAAEHQGWIAQDLAKRNIHVNDKTNQQDKISPYIRNYVGVDTTPGDWVVWWQYAPVLQDLYFVNFNRLAWDGFAFEVQAIQRKQAVLSAVWTFEASQNTQSTQAATFMDELLSAGGAGNYEPGEPIGYISYPVMSSFDDDKDDSSKPVAILTATVYWRSFFQDILPDTAQGMDCVVSNSLGQVFTYRVVGREAKFMGMQDFHDKNYDKYVITAQYQDLLDEQQTTGYTGRSLNSSYASYSIKVYPTAELEEQYVTQRPFWFAVTMFCIFLFTVAIFSVYNCVVERRQEIVLSTAMKTTAVVESLFPENVRARLMEEAGMGGDNKKLSTLAMDASSHTPSSSKPIADFFAETTIMFADLVGFTAWSSVREPSQVFTLLETVYNSFDEIAKKRNVFKVETVGDCYVAVAGLPNPRSDHAVVMARFATDCLRRLGHVTTQLEVELGPGTSNLNMRFGLHSGAVTAGVLRGDRSRFQLFGDTVNTASRMESTSVKGRIQVSEETAELLRQAGKGAWLKARNETVLAKGKGEFQTYFVDIRSVAASSSIGKGEESEASTSSGGKEEELFFNETDARFDAELDRLVKWNAEVLCKILRQIVARRMSTGHDSASNNGRASIASSFAAKDEIKHTTCPLEEVQEIIVLPKFDRRSAVKEVDPSTVKLAPKVEEQVLDLVQVIARTYRKNPFHNFKHATHVTMSVVKLLSRIVAPQDVDYTGLTTKDQVAGTLHDHTYGITSDPLTHFAAVFAALIHDADHPGVPNNQLIKENTNEARVYQNRSIAEQNSLALTWEILMDDAYTALRQTMCATREEYDRFRQLTVNLVMATDIMDKDLKTLRNQRWDKAFATDQSNNELNIHRKATIVLEHLIQASDVAHTMQHWHVYRHHNECLFVEMCKAYDAGRAEKNPADFWYQGEIGFFDYYIIPLAKKLKDCGVFGVSSDEYLTYALRNRAEWVRRGAEVVSELVEKYRQDQQEQRENPPSIVDSSVANSGVALTSS